MIKNTFYLFIFIFQVSLYAKSEIRFAADPWCPFTCEPGTSHEGLIIEISRKIFEDAGYKVSYESVSWSRAVQDSRVGKYDAIMGALKEDAPDFIFPPHSFVDQLSCFFVKKNSNWHFNNTQSLNGTVVGATQDYTYGEPLDAYLKANEKNKKKVEKVSGVDTSLRLLKMLNDKRIQVIVDDKSVMSFTLKNAPSPELKDVKTAGCLKPAPLFVAFSPHVKKEADAMLKVFDEGLLKLRKSGELKKIFESYGLSFSGFRNK